ncbi:MAG: alpha/beta fold hydrolase [Candidatus Hodarchaeales archaeon]|jgi:pimeloyl-ACP methyl ester carboxylesterase
MKYETIELTDDIRQNLSGSFVQLTDGVTHYELSGPEDGKMVVLVHGFSSPSFIWDPVFKDLPKEGFRVLRYDLYGRGTSDRPLTSYDVGLFDRQLYELLSKLGLIQTPVNLVGLSMGGIICINFASKHPELVKKISFIDPAGFPTEKSLYPPILRIPILNRIILKFFITHKRLIEGQKPDFYNYEFLDDYLAKYQKQMEFTGFKRAIVSTVLNIPLSGFEDVYRNVAASQLPMQLFWGKEDQTIPFSTNEIARTIIPSIEFHAIKDSGHIPHYTHPEEVIPFLVEFLQRK